MKNEVMSKVGDYIDALAKNLGVAVEHVYKVLVHQQLVVGIAQLVIGAILLTALIVSVKLTINIFTKKEFVEEETDRYYKRTFPNNVYANLYNSDFVEDGYIWVVGGIVWVILAIVSPILLTEGILHTFNPEYYAIKEIMDVFKGD